MSQKKEPFIGKDLRPKITPDTRLSELTVNDLIEMLGGSKSGSLKNLKYLLGDNLKSLLKDIIKDWKEVALEKHTGNENISLSRDWVVLEEILEGISGEIVSIKEQLSKGN